MALKDLMKEIGILLEALQAYTRPTLKELRSTLIATPELSLQDRVVLLLHLGMTFALDIVAVLPCLKSLRRCPPSPTDLY